MTEEMVGQYLKAHPAFLEAWIMSEIEIETLERWIIRRTQRDKNKIHNENNEEDAKIPDSAPGTSTDPGTGPDNEPSVGPEFEHGFLRDTELDNELKTQTDSESGTRPRTAFDTKPGTPDSVSEFVPGTLPNTEFDNQPVTEPANKPGLHSQPGTDASTERVTGHGIKPGTRLNITPGTELEIEPGIHPGTKSDTKLELRPVTEMSLKPNDDSKITRKTSLSRWKFCVHADKRKMLQELTQALHVKPNKAHILWELCQCIASAVNADGLNLYLTNQLKNNLRRHVEIPSPEDGKETSLEIREGSYICAWVASTRHTIRVSGASKDPRFPEGFPQTNLPEAFHVLAMPVTQSSGELAAVLELHRKESSDAFHEEDEEIVNSYLVWGGIALHYAELYHNMTKQRRLNEFMLSVVKSIFQDMVSMDTLIMKVMNFAQRLVSADRASLFLVDNKNRQLYARIFDIGSDSTTGTDTPQDYREIRFPIGTGIAGIVAQTGEVLNIADAYGDPRFNRNVDQITGYVTKSILCMPIFIRGNVIGVMQMVNKATGGFTKEDEESFEMFAVYCGLALHHAKLYDKIRRSEQKYKVALEVLSYHNTCSNVEFETIRNERISCFIPDLDNFFFSPLGLGDLDKVRHTIYMFVDLFGLARFDKDCLIRFCLTVRKNYRRVPYHNWTHGFSVANSMYTIIKKDPRAFRPLECLSLFIGALCHDLDHRGKNNKFLLDNDSPLAAIYTTSTLEHHHFNQTVTILQQDGHNIFNKLTPSEYKQVLGNIKHCILATDLALFFPNKAKLTTLMEEDRFNWDDPDHRLTLEAVAMTACDLCASSKPWEIQAETVKVIFEEFYEQGDAEKEAGRVPIPMMDREKPEEQPSSQVGFLSGICIPCYDLIAHLIPSSKPLLEGCKRNLERWKRLEMEARAGVGKMEGKEKREEEEQDEPSRQQEEEERDQDQGETGGDTKGGRKEGDDEKSKMGSNKNKGNVEKEEIEESSQEIKEENGESESNCDGKVKNERSCPASEGEKKTSKKAPSAGRTEKSPDRDETRTQNIP